MASVVNYGQLNKVVRVKGFAFTENFTLRSFLIFSAIIGNRRVQINRDSLQRGLKTLTLKREDMKADKLG